jgi:hypothetical protein
MASAGYNNLFPVGMILSETKLISYKYSRSGRFLYLGVRKPDIFPIRKLLGWYDER